MTPGSGDSSADPVVRVRSADGADEDGDQPAADAHETRAAGLWRPAVVAFLAAAAVGAAVRAWQIGSRAP